jgi:hypothetical protein
MQRRPTAPSRTRTLELETARRQIAVRLIIQSLQGWRHGDPFLRQAAASLERRQALRRQPWRQPLRPTHESVSLLEKIRRFEARARAH